MTADALATLPDFSGRVARRLPSGGIYHSPRGLYTFQATGIADGYLRLEMHGQHDGVLVVWDTGTGKQAGVSEPVLTPGGWRTMGDLRPGDEVFSGSDGRPAQVLSIHPQQDRTSYRVTFSDGSWTRCGPEHLWTVTYWGSDRSTGKQRRVRRTETITLNEIMHRGVATPQGRRRFSIPMTAPVQYPARDLPMDAYALGVILGDGWINSAGRVEITTDKEILDALDAPGSSRPHPRGSDGISVLGSTHWAQALVDLGLAGHRSWEKFVPEMYLRASEADRRALLAGLIDTDGSPMDEGGVEFSTTSEALADSVVELAESLGGQGRKTGPRITSYSYQGEIKQGRPSWRVNVKVADQPFRLARKAVRWVKPTKYPVARWIESVERVEDEDQVCIRIDRADGLYLTRHHIVTHNTHFAMALAALLYEDDQIDAVLLVAEKGKVGEWVEDITNFTCLTAFLHHGTGRQARFLKVGVPDVLVSTYETLKADMATKIKTPGKRGTSWQDDWLLQHYQGKRVLVVYDEITKLKNRGSDNYKAHTHMLKALSKAAPLRVVGLTATPVEKDYEDAFNQGRLLRPDLMPTVGDFEKQFVRGRDPFGRPTYRHDQMHLFAEMMRPLIIRKRKTDPDVIDQFPSQVEESRHLVLPEAQYTFYEAIEALGTDYLAENEEPMPGLWTVLRQIAGYPEALLHSQGGLAQQIVAAFGADYLKGVPSGKKDWLLEYLEPLVLGQQEKAVVFTFFGQSILPLLARDLRTKKIRVFLNHGGMSPAQQTESRVGFRTHQGPAVFLTSDAGARGLNLPEATYLVEYESALTFANRTQRINRVHRIDSTKSIVHAMTAFADYTVEDLIAHKMIGRNEQHDVLLDEQDNGENFISASDRRAMLSIAKGRKTKR